MAYQAENPLYLPMKLSFFPTDVLKKGPFSYYLLLLCDVDIDADEVMLQHFTEI